MHKGVESLSIYTAHITKDYSGSKMTMMCIVGLVAATHDCYSYDFYFGFWRLSGRLQSQKSVSGISIGIALNSSINHLPNNQTPSLASGILLTP